VEDVLWGIAKIYIEVCGILHRLGADCLRAETVENCKNEEEMKMSSTNQDNSLRFAKAYHICRKTVVCGPSATIRVGARPRTQPHFFRAIFESVIRWQFAERAAGLWTRRDGATWMLPGRRR